MLMPNTPWLGLGLGGLERSTVQIGGNHCRENQGAYSTCGMGPFPG